MQDIPVDEEERIRIGVIERGVRECRSDLNRITDDVKKEIENYRSGLTVAEDILSKDCADIVRDAQRIANSVFVTIDGIVSSLWILWHLFFLTLRTGYHFVVVIYKVFYKRDFDVTISNVDRAHIDDKYLSCCIEFWFEEVESFLKENYESQISDVNPNREGLENLLDSLEGIGDLSQIPEPHREFKHYKLLMKNRRLVDKNREKALIRKLKKICLESIISNSNAFRVESDFLEAFVTFMRASKNTRDIVAELDLQRFCSGDLPLGGLIENIENLTRVGNDGNLAGLKEATVSLKREKNPSLSRTSRDVIKAYAKPVEVAEKTVDGRSVIEAVGKSIVVSDILDQLETLIEENSDIEEVRFVGSDVHVDRNLESATWHGKNIVILATMMKIYDNVYWDVSGKDSDHIYLGNAGTDQDGNGKQGADGHAGESGGNVFIVADEVINPDNFTVISNGGNGSKGQDGGDGRDGDDGIGIRSDEFDQKFPSVIKIFDLSSNRSHETALSIMQPFPGRTDIWEEDQDLFVNVTTTEKNQITYSYAGKSLTCCRQAFLLYKGSPGKTGKHGGEYGLGGQGGHGGEITYQNIINHGEPGKEGAIGLGGLYGSPGKNGWDMGYMDYQYWSKTEFRGRDENSIIQVKYHDSYWLGAPSSSVWCPRRGEYAEFTCAPIEYRKGSQYQQRNEKKRDSKLERQAQAVKKKSISQGKIMADYSHCYNSLDRTMSAGVRSKLDNIIQRAVQAMIENAQQQEKVTTQLKVKHMISSISSDRNTRRNNRRTAVATSTDTSYHQPDIQSMIRELTTDDGMHRDSRLRNTELSRSQLVEIFREFDANSELLGETKNDEVRGVKELLIEKYRLAVLRDIAQNRLLPDNYYDVTDNRIQLTAESASRYLVVTDDNVDEISHNVLGTLNQYFYGTGNEKRENVCQYCDQISRGTDNEPLKRSVRTFVLGAVKSSRVNPNVQKYYDEYREFLKIQLHDLNILLEPLRSELEKHKDINALWLKRNDDESIRFELNRKIGKHKVLNVLYRCFNKQLKETYDWSKCWRDDDFLGLYYKDIRERGPLSESYRELLAHVFDVNIRFYAQYQDNQYRLVDDHNPSAELQATHILNAKNKLKQLKIDVDFLKLEKERAKTGHVYAQILAKINTFREKQEFDHYLTDISENNDPQCQFSDENELYLSSEDQVILEIIKYFSCPDERLRMKERLQNISSRYIGHHHRILHYILKRFTNDGRHVSYQELCSLVNSILASVIDDKNDLNIFCWIVAAWPQNNWTDELVLLQIENHFKKRITDKLKWRDYLSKVTDKNILMLFKSKLNQTKLKSSISIDVVEEIMRLLSSIPNDLVNLDRTELSVWPYVMKEHYWNRKLSPLANGRESKELSEASYYLLSMENIFGASLVTEFIENLVRKGPTPEVLTDTLANFCNGNWNLDETEVNSLFAQPLGAWTEKMREKFSMDDTDRDVTRLVELIKGSANSSKSVVELLTKIENSICSRCVHEDVTIRAISWSIVRLVEWVKANNNYDEGTFDDAAGIEDVVRIICQYEPKTSRSNGYDIENTDYQILCYRTIFRKYSKSYLDSITESDERMEFLDEVRADMLAAIDRVVDKERGFKLRDTQKLAILVLLTNKQNTLAQVSTGEGKSLIVVVASIMKALLGEKVHVITSSSVLAIRDAKENRDIYGTFGIGVSHNCTENIDERKAAYSSFQVVYGDLSSFQRDYLLDKFYGTNILGDCHFENVFVDEVDSMLLDKGNNVLYLSHDLAGLDKLESIYLYIWQCVNRPATSPEDFPFIFDVEAIKKSVLNDLHGLLNKEDVQKIDPKLGDQEVKLIWESLIEAGILDEEGKLLRERIDNQELETILSSDFSSYANRLSFLLNKRIERVKLIRVPNYLKPFVEQHLESWIGKAVTAATIQAGHDYIIDVDKTGTSPNRNPCIIIVDRDTGTDQTNSQWDEALHQFLQLKHGCKLSMQSLKAVFISNVTYLKEYRNLYGLTGTLGSQPERTLLKEVHDVAFVTIPTSKSKKFIEKPPILCANKHEWTEKIYNESVEIVQKCKRSILIICETIDAAETLYKDFRERGTTENVHIYKRDHEEFSVAQGRNELGQEQIIISTNLSGRGTDLKIANELNESGGLHVCATYLSNKRILEQAFGRAARKGDNGSGRLIIIAVGSRGEEFGNENIFELRNDVDIEESRRISVLKAYYETQIITEENCFKVFQENFVELKNKVRANTKVGKILLQTCLDKWAFWLDKNSNYMKTVTDEESKKNLEISLNTFISQLASFKCDSSSDWPAWVEGQPIEMIKIAKCLCEDEKYDEAISWFDKVIHSEPSFSEAAHYYKAFALIKKVRLVAPAHKKKILKKAKTELRKAGRLFDEHTQFSMYAGGAIRAIKKCNEKRNIIQIDGYAEQQKILSQLYYVFSKSIDDVFDKPVSPESFLSPDISENLSELLYEELLRNGVLRKPKIKKNISEGAWKKINLDYGISVSELKNYLPQFEGTEIDEKELLIMLKDNVKLPSREDFWKLLIEQDILYEEVECVIVDVQELEKIDPSLLSLLREKIGNNELQQETLTPNNTNGIILHTEQNASQEDCIIVEKSTLQTLMTENKREYKFLEDKGVFSINKKALADTSKVSTVSFPRYDSITLDDLTAANIPRDDAEQILAELVEQNVIKKLISSDVTYGLGIPCEEINLIRLPSYPVYQNDVKTLLSLCFIYKIALRGILRQMQQKDSPVHPRLMSHPHNKLIYQLMDEKIVKPAKLSRRQDDLNATLRKIFNPKIRLRDLENLISRNGLILEKPQVVELCNHLVEKQWLFTVNRSTDKVAQCADEIAALLGHKYYTINVSTKREALTLFEEMKTRIEKIFDERIELAKNSTIEHVIGILEGSTSPLKTLDTPDSRLEALTDHNVELSGSGYIEEMTISTLNGLDHVLLLEEGKWTTKMMVDTAIVAAMGIVQITVGAALEVLSGGIFTYAAASCVNEGIGDIIFAISAYRSGHFSWKAYRQHKVQSLMLTTVTAGFGSFFGKAAVAGGVELANSTGRQLIETVGLNSVAMSVGKIVVSRTLSAAAVGLSYTGIDVLVQNFGKTISEGMSSLFLSSIRGKLDESDIGTSLEAIYRSLGRERATNIVNDLTESSLNEKSLVARYFPIVVQSLQVVSDKIKEALRKITPGENKMFQYLARICSYISAALPWIAERAAYVIEIRNVTGNLLDNLQQKLRHALQTHGLANPNATATVQNPEDAEDCEKFKKDIIEQWDSLICEKTGRIIEQHLVKPVLDVGVRSIMRHCEKIIENKCRRYDVGKSNETLEEQRREYHESQRNSNISTTDAVNGVAECQLDEYQRTLNKFATKQSHSELISAVRENVPMDATCLDACTQAVRKVSGIEGLTIIAKGENCADRESSSSEKHVIELELVDHRFQLYGSSVSRSDGNVNFYNNYLYEAVSQHVNLNMSRERFAFEVANCIQQDNVQCHIEQRYDSFASCRYEYSDNRVLKMTDNKLWRNVDFDEGVNFTFQSTSTPERTCGRIQEPKQPVRQMAGSTKSSWYNNEPFSEVHTSDGFVFMHNSRRVAAAITNSPPTHSLKVMACEEIGESRHDYNSWRRSSKEAIAPRMAHARTMVTEQHVQRTNINWRLRSQKRSSQIRRSNSVGIIHR